MQEKFRIGDRVVVTPQHYLYNDVKSDVGTVVVEDGGTGFFGVEFDEKYVFMHDCQGAARPYRGYYIHAKHLKHLDIEEDHDEPEHITPPDPSLLDIL